jgi:uncharacterized protein (TIGR00730 family)
MTRDLRSLTVFCGSTGHPSEDILTQVKKLAAALSRNQMSLVYGGAAVGLMGRMADEALSLGVHVEGVTPEGLLIGEAPHRGLSELHIVSNMHERKQLMAQLGDAFVAMPGGFGTLEEVFEVLTWNQLGIHQKPCGVLNVNSYFDNLIAFLHHAADEGFIKHENLQMLLVADDADVLLDLMVDWEMPNASKY